MSPRVNGHRPSVDVLLRSVAEEFRATPSESLMTGMGDDGAEGLGAIKKEGGMTIAQSEESCVVYGMPKAAIERGYAVRVVALDVMGARRCRQYAVGMAALPADPDVRRAPETEI